MPCFGFLKYLKNLPLLRVAFILIVALVFRDRNPLSVAFEFLRCRGNSVGLPCFLPLLDCAIGDLQHGFDRCEIAENLIHKIKNLPAGPIGFIEGRGIENRRLVFVIVLKNLLEQIRIPASPGVDGLLCVAHIEKRASLLGIHDHFVDEGFQNFPLGSAGVLKLIEKPVVEFLVDAIARHIAPKPIPRPACKRDRNVCESHEPRRSNLLRVNLLEFLDQGME